MSQTGTPIHDAVREHYAEAARSSTSCCGSSSSSSCGCGETSSGSSLYAPDMIQTLPDDVTNFSLGCGDPITLAQLTPGQSVLDLGSGGGLDCFLAARKVGPTGRVIGVDMTPEMLAKARANAARLGLANVEFRQGYIESLPVDDDSIDVVISNCVINLAPDKSKALAEAFRVLKPGGQLAVSDIVTDGPLPQNIKDSLSAWAGCVAGALEVQQYVALLEQAGFTAIEITPQYFDEVMVGEAVGELQESVDLSAIPQDKLSKAVFSARISARKPA